MEALVWSDYLCPWCYVGQDRSELLRSLGVTVIELPFELHPEIPSEGIDVRGGRAATMYDRIEAECEEVGLPFQRPVHVPNTRRVLETAEWVRQAHPTAFASLHRSLFSAHFAEGRDLGDPATLDELVADAGVDPDAAHAALASGEGWGLVDGSMAVAREMDVTGTPAWLLASKLLIPGTQPRSLFARAVARLQAKAEEAPAPPDGVPPVDQGEAPT